MTDALHIKDPRGLKQLVGRLADAPAIALDTEFLSERTFFAKLCLIQLATPELVAVVDPLACRDLAPLYELLTGKAEIVVHAGSQDLEILLQTAHSLPRNLFDTQIAASFLGHGDSVGYGRLVETLLGVARKRSEAYTDWSRRPLEPDQVTYALDDVRYLLECRDQLDAKLAERKRLAWAQEEFQLLLERVGQGQKPEEAWRRVSGASGLKGVELAILQDLTAWREEEAIRRDRPRRWMIPDRVLIEMARRGPKNDAQLRRLRGLHPKEIDRFGAAVLAVIRRSRDRDPQSFPPRLPRVGRVPDSGVEAVVGLLATLLRVIAEKQKIAPRMLGTHKDLERIVCHYLNGAKTPGPLDDIPLLQGWRRNVAGDVLLQALRGEIALRVSGHPDAYRVDWNSDSDPDPNGPN